MSRKQHWETVYKTKPSDMVSWYQEVPSLSLDLIKSTKLKKDSPIIDVGGGASHLVDFLIKDGYTNISVLDLSSSALSIARQRLGVHSTQVNWIVADITQHEPGQKYSLWHDRAVFHFLTENSDRNRYKRLLTNSVEKGGTVIIASFAINGPEKCSGLDIVQYDKNKIQSELGNAFKLVNQIAEVHTTPNSGEQLFNYFVFTKV